uniref:FAD:protein FMN transferase n=1 Tax=Acetithermum autotrophicum TaxID=1446466 RepID=H5SRB2_ACEAU|nr:thiamine biosynthesis lipoprotein [Candidatus Acetothermum autotrophicum]
MRRTLTALKFLIFGVLALSLVLIYLQGRVAVVQEEQYLLGTYFRIKAQSRSQDQAHQAVQAAFAEAKRLSEELSRIGTGSLGELNRRGASEPVTLSDDVFFVLEAAQKYRALSDGAFDPTIGKIVDLWGFTQDWDRSGMGRIPSPEELELLVKEQREVFLDRAAKTARLSSANVEVDLGGIAKGYIVDKVVEILKRYELDSALVDAGGNIRVFNDRPRKVLWWEDRRPFRIAVQHPRDEQQIVGILEIWGDRALATSGDYQRCFFADALKNIFPCRYADEPGKTRYHHIIDPKTGQPARGLISATILAPTAMEADALSTAVFVLGEHRGLALIESLPNVECILITDDGRIVRSSGLKDIEFPTELK